MNTLLTQKKMAVLARLFRSNRAGAGQLAKETAINRTTLYPILGRLSQKGLVTSFSQDGKTMYEPIEREAFREWLKGKADETQQEAKALQGWLKGVASDQSPSLISKIKYYEGFDGVKAMYADSWRNNKDKVIYAITDVRAIMESMGKYTYDEYMPERIAHGVKVKDLMTDNKEGREAVKISKRYLREAKLAKGLFENLGVEINVYDNKLAIAAYDKDKPCGVTIENEKIADAMKNIFNYLWKLS